MKKFFDRMRNAVGKLSCTAIHGPQYAEEKDIDIAEECAFLIAAIQKIEQEPKKGRWTRDYICSNCGCKIYPIDIDFGDFNYCPNCGSYMKEDKE